MTGHIKCIAAKAEVNNPLKLQQNDCCGHKHYKRNNKTQIRAKRTTEPRCRNPTSGFTAVHMELLKGKLSRKKKAHHQGVEPIKGMSIYKVSVMCILQIDK